MSPTTRIDQVLKALREAKGLTQADVAVRAKVTQTYIAKIESGEKRNPGLDTLEGLAAALGVPVATLMLATSIRVWHFTHERWTIGVTPRESGDRCNALIEMWAPGMTPRTHVGLGLPFTKEFASIDVAVKAARTHAESWIDRLPSTKRRK